MLVITRLFGEEGAVVGIRTIFGKAHAGLMARSDLVSTGFIREMLVSRSAKTQPQDHELLSLFYSFTLS